MTGTKTGTKTGKKTGTKTGKNSKSLPAGQPATIGCYLGLVSAVAFVGAGLYLFAVGSRDPTPFKFALVALGVVQAVCCVGALRGSRAGWSFAVALNLTLAIAFFFGSPKVRDMLMVNIGIGLLPSAVFTATFILLTRGHKHY